MIIKSRKEILADMITWSRNNGSTLTDFNQGSAVRSIFNAVAAILARLYYNMHTVYRSSRILTATGTDLEKLVAARSITRRSASKATVVLKFSGTDATNVPTGTQASTKDGITFSTTESGDISGGSVELDAEADVAGKSGNVKANTITTMVSSVTGVDSVTNEKQSSGGFDTETDEQLRNRAVTQLATLSQGIQASYNAWATEANSEVLKAKARWNPPGYSDRTVVAYVVKDNGGTFDTPDLGNIEAYIQTKAPLGVEVKCENISWTIVDITVKVRRKSGFSLADVDTNITNNLNLYLDWREWDWGDDVEWADIFSLVNNTQGVDDVEKATFVPSSNVPVSEFSIPKLGTVTVQDW